LGRIPWPLSPSTGRCNWRTGGRKRLLLRGWFWAVRSLPRL
jgi:hypothetical protein